MKPRRPASKLRATPTPSESDVEGRLRVSELCLRYADVVTRREPDLLTQLFLPDAEWVLPGLGSIRGVDAIVRTTRELMAGHSHLIHAVHGTLVELHGEHARAKSYCSEWGRDTSEHDFLMWGVYRDDLVRLPDGWRFKRRRWDFLYRGLQPAVGKFYEQPDPAAW
jgi:hypothetical protein